MEFKWGCNIHGRVEGNIELVRVACCVLSFRSAGCFDMLRFGTHAVWLRKEKTHASSPSSLSSPSSAKQSSMCVAMIRTHTHRHTHTHTHSLATQSLTHSRGSRVGHVLTFIFCGARALVSRLACVAEGP